MRRAPLLRLLVVASLLVAGLHQATASPQDHRAVVDLTFPAGSDARFADDYDAGRSGGRSHRATDLFAAMGSQVYAAVGGRVTWLPGRHATAGYSIHVRGDDGRTYAYYHLGPHGGGAAQAYAPGISEGTTVTRGQLIGYVGDSGNAAGGRPHLHFEIHDDRVTDPQGGNRVNPFRSLTEAVRRGDYGGRTAEVVSRGGDRQPVLRAGNRGSAVVAWQTQLNATAGTALGTDGIFGPATEQATRAFQQARGITVDGVVGPQTRAVAEHLAVAASAAGPGSGSVILRNGDRGPAVVQWQALLNAAAGTGLATDGIFGPATDTATRAFQRAAGIAVDGVVGPQTRGALPV